jgi:hypothetical protein
VIDTDGDRPEHLGKAALRKTTQQLHLSEPQMCVNEPKGDGEVAVSARLDERHKMLVPENFDRTINGSALPGQAGEPPFDRLFTGPVTEARRPQPQG